MDFGVLGPLGLFALGLDDQISVLDASSSRCRCQPVLQRFASQGAERVAGNKMALNVERIVDGGVNGQEPLR